MTIKTAAALSILSLLSLCGSPATATVAAVAAAGLGLVDAREPQALVVVDAVPASGLLPFLRLSDPGARTVECCLRVQKDTQPSSILRLRVSGPIEAQPSTTEQAGHPAQVVGAVEEGPFIGLVLPPGAGARVLWRRANALQLEWTAPGTPRPLRVRVQHCLSSEGLHLWWQRPGGPRVHLYVPLGMAVEADCRKAGLKP